MRINSLHLEGFRNYPRLSADFDAAVNVVCGDNAQGKTNLLEAVAYLSGASHRTRFDRELIAFGADSALLRGEVESRGRDFVLEARLYRGRGRQLRSNGVKKKSLSELSEVLNTVLFCPEDLTLIRAGAAERRRFLDECICQLRPRYAEALGEYKRLHEHKTRILRDSAEKPSLLEALDEFSYGMVRAGAVVVHYRARFLRRLQETAPGIHREFSGGREELGLRYETVSAVEDPEAPVSELAERLWEHMQRHRAAEIASRSCLSGPHKDDLTVTVNGQSARTYASQGQTRTAALSLKLAEREIFREDTGEYPVLLLDDVLSELDPRRQEFVLNRIAGGQVFITCCEDDRLGCLAGGRVFHVRDGGFAPGDCEELS